MVNSTSTEQLVYIDLNNNSFYDPSDLVYNITDGNVTVRETFILGNTSWHVKEFTKNSITMANYPTTKVGVNYSFNFIIENHVSNRTILIDEIFVVSSEKVTVSFPVSETNGTEKITVILDSGEEIYFWEKS